MERLGRHEIVRRLALGGMAEVFLARERGLEGLERHVVIKRIRPEHREDDEFVTMFLDEARLLASLSHPCIAQVFELGQHEGAWYLVMEWVRGPTLRTLMQVAAGPLPEREAVAIVIALGEALRYVHERRDEDGLPLRIVHRDINPSNVIVSWDGAVKLIDFGIAKAATQVYETSTGVVKGTAGYMSPEQIEASREIDHRSDVYSLGVILYEACLGRHPFQHVEPAALYDHVLAGKFAPPRRIAPAFPASLAAVIEGCLAPDPDERPESVRELIESLAAHLASTRTVPTMSELATLTRRLVPDAEGAPAVTGPRELVTSVDRTTPRGSP